MYKIFILFVISLILSWCTNPEKDMEWENIIVESPTIIHTVEKKIIPIVGDQGYLNEEVRDIYCRQVGKNEDWSTLPVIAPYICTNLPLYIHSYFMPSLNLQWWIYDSKYYDINEYSKSFYLTTGDHSTFVVSGDMLIDNFMTWLSKDPLWFNDYEFYIEKKYFWSWEVKKDIIDTIGNTQFSGYVLEPDSLITWLKTSQRYDGNYDIYQISYRMNPERQIFPLMAVTYIFSPQDKNYYYVEYSKSDGWTWFKSEINRLQLFVE